MSALGTSAGVYFYNVYNVSVQDSPNTTSAVTYLTKARTYSASTDIKTQYNGKSFITLKNKANKYRSERNNDINSFNKKKIDATNKLLNTINPILIEYSDKNSISMIFQKKNIIIGKSDLDITDEILKIVDSKINKIKIN